MICECGERIVLLGDLCFCYNCGWLIHPSRRIYPKY